MDIPAGHVGPLGATTALVQSVATNGADYADRITKARASLSEGITVWGAEVLEHVDERSRALRAFEDLVNDLRARNTVGKLNRLDRTREQIAAARDGRRALAWIENAADVAAHLANVTAYLREAADAFGQSGPGQRRSRRAAFRPARAVPLRRPSQQGERQRSAGER